MSHTSTSAKSGVAATGTKGQAALNNAEEIPYELKLNITDSEIVVVEDTSQWDTNAVILKVTKVLFCDTSITDKFMGPVQLFASYPFNSFIKFPVIMHCIL
jgi:hypothetical protein